MSRSNILCIVSIYIFLNICFHEAGSVSSKSCPIFDQKPSIDAYSPINIITKDAIRANVSTPVNLRDGVFGPLLVTVRKNKMILVEADGNPEVISGGLIYGGVLCGREFRFHKLRAYISQDPNGRSYNKINGKGSPLSIVLHYYDKKYGFFEEALKHPGGVLVVSYMITYGSLPNPFFLLPQIALLLIFRFPGVALYFAPEILLYEWFNIIFLINEYYAFWGSYYDPMTGQEFPNVIQIQTAGIYPLLSRSQLAAFQSLFSRNFTLLETVAPFHESKVPIYVGKGYTETYTLF